jgi:hypothetical protein
MSLSKLPLEIIFSETVLGLSVPLKNLFLHAKNPFSGAKSLSALVIGIYNTAIKWQ